MPNGVTGTVGSVTTVVLAGAVVRDILRRLDENINTYISRAVASGDYLLEKNARTLSVLLSTANAMLRSDMEEAFDKLGSMEQQLLTGINQLVDQIAQATAKVERLEELLILDIQDLLNRFNHASLLFSLDKSYTLLRVEGASQVYQEKGEYRFTLRGNIFDDDDDTVVSISVAGNAPGDVLSERKNEAQFSIPVSVLNNQFKDNEAARVDFKVRMVRFRHKYVIGPKVEEEVFTHQGKVVLLPKLPVAVTVTEHYETAGWSNETFQSDIGSTLCPKTGKSGEKHGTTHYVSTTIPPGCLMLRDTVTMWCTPYGLNDWGRPVGDWVFQDDYHIVGRYYFHFIHDQDRTIYIRVNYKKPTKQMQTRDVAFPDAIAGHLTYGTHLLDLSSTYQTYDLRIVYFWGKEALLTPASPSAQGIRVAIESPNGGMHRMVLTIEKE